VTAMVRGLVAAAVIGFALLAGWRVVGQMQAELFAQADPGQALRWLPGQPTAMVSLAQKQLNGGQAEAAASTARLLLEQEPLEGVAYRILAESTERQGHHDKALELYRIASRRAPRDTRASAWLVGSFIEQGAYPQALALVDRMLRTAPERTKATNPILSSLAPLAQDDKFADALVSVLQESPPWRETMLSYLRGYPDAASRVMQGLHDNGGLSAMEYASWLDGLISAGKWGEAYARWAGGVVMIGGRLPLLYNGDFSRMPSNVGFDWRLKLVPGVLVTFEQVAGIQGKSARFQFLDQRVPESGLEQPLLLSPGHYRLGMRMRADALRGEIGLQWVMACAGTAGEIARSDPITGTFGWRASGNEFTVPAENCPGQWLRLVNPIAEGAGQRLAGELWIADMDIKRLPDPGAE
jgi:hypothetical protein